MEIDGRVIWGPRDGLITSLDDLKDGYWYAKSRLENITLSRGRRLPEALKNDPLAPKPFLVKLSHAYTREQIIRFVETYQREDALIDAVTGGAVQAIRDADQRAVAAEAKSEEAIQSAKALADTVRAKALADARPEIDDACRAAAKLLLDKFAHKLSGPFRPSGVYFLMKRDKVVYVGQSVNVHARIGQHASSKSFDSVRVLPCEPRELDEYEGFFIRLLKPKLNIDRNGKVHAPNSKLWDKTRVVEYLLSPNDEQNTS